MKYLLLVLALIVGTSYANEESQDFQKDLDQLCEKTTACAKAQLPPAMQGMADQMLGGMCQAYDQAFNAVHEPGLRE